MRLPPRSAVIAACASLLALIAACDENGVRITTTTTNDDAGGVLKVVGALQCPDTLGALTRKGSAQADGTVCTYSGPRGAEVSLHLVALTGQNADAALKGFETQLMAAMPHTMAQLNQSRADEAQGQAEAARGEAEAARGEAEAARGEAEAAGAEARANADAVSVAAPGMQINTEGDRASIHMPGIHIDADGDKADVRIGGLTINADDSVDGPRTASVHGSLNQDMVSIQARDNSTQVRTRAPGDATRQTFILTDSRPSPDGWRTVGYEARGPQGGPIVVATVRTKDRDGDRVFDDAKALVALNVGE